MDCKTSECFFFLSFPAGNIDRLPPRLRRGLTLVANDYLRRTNSRRFDRPRTALQRRKYRGRPRQGTGLYG